MKDINVILNYLWKHFINFKSVSIICLVYLLYNMVILCICMFVCVSRAMHAAMWVMGKFQNKS